MGLGVAVTVVTEAVVLVAVVLVGSQLVFGDLWSGSALGSAAGRAVTPRARARRETMNEAFMLRLVRSVMLEEIGGLGR